MVELELKPRLTVADKVLIGHLANGLSTKEIATKLDCSLCTTHNRLKILYAKTGMSRIQLAGYGQLRSLLGHDPELMQMIQDRVRKNRELLSR